MTGRMVTVAANLMAGAAALQVGTANYAEPAISLRLADELDSWLAERDLSLGDIVGAAQD